MNIAGLHVALIADQFFNAEGGTERQLVLLASSLVATGVNLQVLFLRSPGCFPDLVPNVPCRSLGITRLASWAAIKVAANAARGLRKSGVQVCHTYFNDSSILFPPLLRMSGLAVVVSRRDLGFWYTAANTAVLRVNARCFVDRFVANCAAVGEVVARQEWARRSGIAVIGNPVAQQLTEMPMAEARVSLDLPTDAEVITIVANLRPLKRIDVAIEAVARLRSRFPRAVLLIAGDDSPGRQGPSHLAELRALVGELGIAERVRFLGRVGDPSAAICAANLCLLTSETEGSSNSIIEYMCLGRPVVCTAVGGNSELVRDGREGLLVPVGDVQATSVGLERILSEPEFGKMLGEQGRIRARAEFAAARLAERHERLYRQLARRGH